LPGYANKKGKKYHDNKEYLEKGAGQKKHLVFDKKRGLKRNEKEIFFGNIIFNTSNPPK